MVHGKVDTPKDSVKVLVLMGSVRAGRLCPTLARWVVEIACDATGLDYELVDLKDWSLPMDDEPDIPALGRYAQEHTRAWSAKVASAAAIVIVTPQYNWGYPAVLKNAIDHLYREWQGKPVVIVTYGGHGGGKCAAQLRQIAEGLDMRVAATMPGIVLKREVIQGAAVDLEDIEEQAGSIRQAVRELEQML